MNKKQIAQINEALKQKKEVNENPGKGIASLIPEKDAIISPHPPTRRTTAMVKVMLSYNYCHFESSIQLEGDNITLADIDGARKDCQRLCDKAVGQYKTAKEQETRRTSNTYEREQLEREVRQIKQTKTEQERTPLDNAKIKTLEDYNYQTRYDYDDDSNYQPF